MSNNISRKNSHKLHCDKDCVFSVSDDLFLLVWFKKQTRNWLFFDGLGPLLPQFPTFWTFHCLLESPPRIMKRLEIWIWLVKRIVTMIDTVANKSLASTLTFLIIMSHHVSELAKIWFCIWGHLLWLLVRHHHYNSSGFSLCKMPYIRQFLLWRLFFHMYEDFSVSVDLKYPVMLVISFPC